MWKSGANGKSPYFAIGAVNGGLTNPRRRRLMPNGRRPAVTRRQLRGMIAAASRGGVRALYDRGRPVVAGRSIIERKAYPMPVALVTNAGDYAGPPAVAALAEAGFRVLVHDRSFADAAAWSAFAAAHPSAERIDADDPASLVEFAWQSAGRIDAVVGNDHWPAIHGPTEQASLDDLRRTLEVLVVDPFALMKAAIPRLKAQSGGNVVMITSCRTRLPMPGGAIPDAARAAANALVASFAIELAPHDIAVNAVAPNFLYSEAYYPRAVFVDDPKGQAFVKASVPAGRLGRPEEIGEVIRFLATTNARFLTGAIVDFAGAWPAAAPRPA
jgi:NAD(P)-dependent dehydrogenase (short-subunit alcohol dehydrogenase family)